MCRRRLKTAAISIDRNQDTNALIIDSQSRATRTDGNERLLRQRLLRTSCPAPAAPPGFRRGSIPVEDLEQAERSIGRRLRWLLSQPLGGCAPLGRVLLVRIGESGSGRHAVKLVAGSIISTEKNYAANFGSAGVSDTR
jgi:hypothetical protein